MFRKNVSGQFVYLGLVSALSGNAVIGASGQISGRRSIDGAVQGLFSGFITEIGGGQYVLNGFDFDFNGNNIGMLFTASGCVPVNYTVLTIGGISGQVFIASGQNVNIFSGQLSGYQVNLLSGNQVGIWSGAQVNVFSGTNVNVFSGQLSGYTINPNSGATWLTSGHQAALYSGQNVNVFSGQLSGQVVSLLSGQLSGQRVVADVQFWKAKPPNDLVASGRVDAQHSLNWGIAASGTATTIQLGLANSPPLGTSGVLNGQLVTIFAGNGITQTRQIISYDSSGMATISPPWEATVDNASLYIVHPGYFQMSGKEYLSSGQSTSLNSGQSVLVYSGQISGQQVNLLSGNQTAVVSGTNVNIWSGQTQIASGPFVVATANVGSGTLYLASGSIFMNTFASGVVGGGSGNIPSAWGGSGAATIGQNLDKSGYIANSLSGTTYIASGPFVVSVPISGQTYLASGQNVNVFSGQLSGYTINPNSGAFTTSPLASGTAYLASGQITTEIPKSLLIYDYSGAPNVSGQRNLLNATRKLINKFDTAAVSGFLSVYREDDTTLAYQQAITSVSGAQPITSLDTQ